MAISALSTQLVAQGTGTIRGRVTSSATSNGVANAQVFVVNTRAMIAGRIASLGGMTQGDGNFQINGVPAGNQVVRVRMIGFGPAEKSVTVTAGQVASVDVVLTPSAVSLDEVVVTGTAGTARKREVGNSMGQIRLSEVPEVSNNISNMLAGRVAGVNVTQSAGNSGAGSSIRLRGSTSVALSNQPLIYVDGVRIRGDEYPKNSPPTAGQGLRSSNVNASPLNDIAPEDIERVEIIKGAAATTLFGTDAAAGVIQVFTKRGSQGKPEWNFTANNGFSRLRPFGTDSVPYMHMDPWIRDGARNQYSGSVAGGSQGSLRYFVSGNYDNNDGVLPKDNETKGIVRGNFGFTPNAKLNLDWSSSYTKDFLEQTPAGNNAQGLTLNAYRQERNYFGDSSTKVIKEVLKYDINSDIDHLVLGGTATWTPLTWLNNRMTIGVDRAAVENRQVRPFGFIPAPQGIVTNQRWSNLTYTLDYVGNVDRNIWTDFKSTSSWGGQYTKSEVSDISVYAEGFAGPGVPTISGGAVSLGFETRQTVVTAGFFLQQLFGFKDRYFLTAGARIDGNSAFGKSFGLQTYPKVSLSWVTSDESWWPKNLGTLKARAAYGEAGRAPGAFDAVQTWDPVGWGGQPAFRPRNLGNENLGPERTKETEFGFDLSTLQSRLNVDFTYFNANTQDALLPVRSVPSQGFLNSQLRNVGVLNRKGIELSVNGTVVDRAHFGWTLGAALSTNSSTARDLGGAPSFSLGNFGWVIQGEAVPVIRAKIIRNPNAIGAEPDTASNYLYGPSTPKRIISMNTSVRTWKGIEISMRGEYQGGHFIDEDASFQALSRAVRWPSCGRAFQYLPPVTATPDLSKLTVRERLTCIQANVRSDMFIFPADFFKIRDVSVRIPLGKLIPGTRNSQFVMSAANWYRWKKGLPLFDPEMSTNGGFNESVRGITEHIPAPATFNAQLRLVF
jgi:outer membrane receptor protein involved in Fe transport